MNSSTLILGGVCALLVGGLVVQHRSSTAEQTALTNELGKMSNDWKQAVFKLDEQGRLAYTLQTQLKLVQEEHLSVTNELPKVRSALSTLESNHVMLVDRALSVSNRLQFQVMELQDQQGDHRERMTQMQSKLLSAETQVAHLRETAKQVMAQLNAASNALTVADKTKAQLEGQLRDPVVLAAQLNRFGEASKERVRRDVERGTEKLRVELLPDGSVKQIP
jgi:septal ring factor EnvC (AmiA/AmiB activator)